MPCEPSSNKRGHFYRKTIDMVVAAVVSGTANKLFRKFLGLTTVITILLSRPFGVQSKVKRREDKTSGRYANVAISIIQAVKTFST